jgi:hypothetical protein
MTISTSDKNFFEATGRNLNEYSQMRLFNVLMDHDRITRFMNVFRAFKYNSDILKDVSFYSTYEVGDNEWWDNIAYKHYGTPYLWWVLPSFNNIVNPFESLEPGTNIKILRSNYIYGLIRDMENLSEK